MHKFNVLTFGSKNFITSLEELKDYFNFTLTFHSENSELESYQDYDVLLVHGDFLEKIDLMKGLFKKKDQIKIVLSKPNQIISDKFHDKLLLPFSVDELNKIIENSIAKKRFSKNSGIIIKEYNLDKNEKKLSKGSNFIALTEKEIHLLELFLKNTESIPKDEILKKVWKYAKDADTHTVETHIYRLRKKIKDKFSDEKFILNDKKGYYL
tara:strand:- start:1041 stop:1670 length:630 start_codon:yes stop_codon:yes gene_type:complete